MADTTARDRATVDGWMNETYFTLKTNKAKDGKFQRELSITIRDFLHIATTHSRDLSHWLTDNAIDISLALLTEEKGAPECLVLPTFASQILCRVGLGAYKYKPEQEKEFEETTVAALKDDTIRWIIAPCNDGMLMGHTVPKGSGKTPNREAANSTSDTEAPQETQPAAPPTKQAGVGTHWGLLIIDKKNRAAWWIDSFLDVRKGPHGKYIIHHMPNAGRAAGKALRGYEKLVGSEKHRFETSTLKHVPHQTKNNKFQGDEGACGPYVYAMLNWLYTHDETFPDNPRKIFSSAPRRKKAVADSMGFHSKNTRETMQESIQRAREDEETDKDFRLRLNSEVMRVIGLEINPQEVLRHVNKFYRTSSQSAHRPSGDGSRSNPDDDDSDDDDDNDDGNINLKSQWREAQKKGEIANDMSFDDYQIALAASQPRHDNPARDSANGTADTGTTTPNGTKRKSPEDGGRDPKRHAGGESGTENLPAGTNEPRPSQSNPHPENPSTTTHPNPIPPKPNRPNTIRSKWTPRPVNSEDPGNPFPTILNTPSWSPLTPKTSSTKVRDGASPSKAPKEASLSKAPEGVSSNKDPKGVPPKTTPRNRSEIREGLRPRPRKSLAAIEEEQRRVDQEKAKAARATRSPSNGPKKTTKSPTNAGIKKTPPKKTNKGPTPSKMA